MDHDVREKLAAIWTDLLGGAGVPAEADFFACGGTSISAVYLAANVQESFGVTFDALEVVLERTFDKMTKLISDRLAQPS